MRYLAKCLDCPQVFNRYFGSLDEREAWAGRHVDVTHHQIVRWEEGDGSD